VNKIKNSPLYRILQAFINKTVEASYYSRTNTLIFQKHYTALVNCGETTTATPNVTLVARRRKRAGTQNFGYVCLCLCAAIFFLSFEKSTLACIA